MMHDYFQSLIANCASKWRPVVGYEGLYEISMDGHLRSLDRTVIASRSTGMVPKNLKGRPVRTGLSRSHKYVSLCRGGVPRRASIHALVAAAFIGARPPGLVIDHVDGDPLNNNASNLRYCTQSVNISKQKNTNRPFLGTSYVSDKKKYKASIRSNGKFEFIGYYETREEALKARIAREIEVLGKDAPIRETK